MAITFVGQVAYSRGGLDGGAITVPQITGIRKGDLIVFVSMNSDNSQSSRPTDLTGWTSLAGTTGVMAYWRFADPGVDPAGGWATTSSSALSSRILGTAAFRGVHPIRPISVFGSSGYVGAASNTTPIPIPSINTLGDETYLAQIAFTPSPRGFVAPSGTIKDADSTYPNSNGGLATGHEALQKKAAATGVRNWLMSAAGAVNAAGVVLALNPDVSSKWGQSI